MMDKKNFLPKLYPLSRDMQKTWFVKYKNQSGRPLKAYGKLNHLPTAKERYKEAKKIIRDLLQPELLRKEQAIGLPGKLEAVLDYKRPRLAGKSYISYLSFLRGFCAWYHKQPKGVDPGDYVRFMYSEGYHTNYILRCKITLGSFFKVLVKKAEYPVNPFADIRIKKIKAQSLLPFHANQVATLKKTILEKDPQLWDACLFEYYLFFRPKEIRMLRIENVLFDEMQVSVGSDITKDDDVLLKAIPVPMRATIEKYRQYPQGWFIFGNGGLPGPQMLSRDALSKRHRKVLDELGYSHKYAFYSWVHTGARDAAMSGIPLKQLQLQKGHSDLKMFDEYLKNIGVRDCVQLVSNFPEI